MSIFEMKPSSNSHLCSREMAAAGSMYNLSDQFTKNLLRDGLSRASIAETEVEVLAATQRIDVYAVPDPAREAERADMGWLGELSAAPSIFETYRNTPSLRLGRQCLRKQLTWHHELERRASSGRAARSATAAAPAQEDPDVQVTVPFPELVIVSPGRPETLLSAYGFQEVRPGLHRAVPGLATWVVVLAEVPRTRATLLLRLLGSGRILREALADLAALPADAWERGVTTPLLIHFRIGIEHQPASSPEDDVSAEIRAWYEEYKQAEQRARLEARNEGLREGRNEGLREGRNEGVLAGERKVLLRQLRARFGELPAAALARIEAAGEVELDLWSDRVLAARTLEDVLGPPS
jgi:hypothetical protein